MGCCCDDPAASGGECCDLADTLAVGADAGGIEITGLGAPSTPDSAARLFDVTSILSISAKATGHSAGLDVPIGDFLPLTAIVGDCTIIAGPTGNLVVPPALNNYGIWNVFAEIEFVLGVPADINAFFALVETDLAGAPIGLIGSSANKLLAAQLTGSAATFVVGGRVDWRAINVDRAWGIQQVSSLPVQISAVRISLFRDGG